MAPPRTCECMDCPKCHVREWARERYRQQAYGQWNPHAELEPVREHLAHLRDAGLGFKAIAAASGLGRVTVQQIAYGKTQRIYRETAQRILAVTPDDKLQMSPHHVTRRVQALNAIGYSTRHLADLLGMTQEVVSDHLAGKRKWVTHETVERVRKVYEACSMTPGGNRHSVRIAASRGYAPPLAWDDIDHDEAPAVAPECDDLDHAVIERLLAGETVPSTPAEKAEVLRRWVALGGSEKELCRVHGWRAGRYSETARKAS